MCAATPPTFFVHLIRYQGRGRAARNSGYEGPGATTIEVKQYAMERHGGLNASRFGDVLTDYAPWFTSRLGCNETSQSETSPGEIHGTL